MNFALQALVDGQWVTYQRIDDWFSWSSSISLGVELQNETDQIANVLSDKHHSRVPESELHQSWFYSWRDWESSSTNPFHNPTMQMYQKIDPRTGRLGHGSAANVDRLGESIRPGMGAFPTGNSGRSSLIWSPQHGLQGRQMGLHTFSGPTGTHEEPMYGFEFLNNFTGTIGTGGLLTNHPRRLDTYHPLRYASRDRVVRPADGYFGRDPDPDNIDLMDRFDLINLPTVPGRYLERPVILNRPFRSVGELGYVFRDEPWKTLDFFSRYSADLGLLDVFSLDESVEEPPLVAGKVNLNSARPEVLAALLRGTTQQLAGINPEVPQSFLSADDAQGLAERVVQESRFEPFAHRGDLVPRVMDREGGEEVFDPSPYLATTVVKAHREAAVRTLTEIGTTRTWNIMLDLVAQSGRFTAASQGPEDFLVTGEKRYWVHLAIDRITGDILDIKKEIVYD